MVDSRLAWLLLTGLPLLITLPILFDVTKSMDECNTEVDLVLQAATSSGKIPQPAAERMITTCNGMATKGKAYAGIFGLKP